MDSANYYDTGSAKIHLGYVEKEQRSLKTIYKKIMTKGFLLLP
ncbi:hypothetical protein LEP1GSC193_2548 [Leptospira alstonii serovar Pingchang str. 80-412]|uniref:Uncharacterized protein n=2 Tax=Leptospira alstonii TaxID=28452 RepID=M6DIB5_9LEPT|nr:hypothetical protein LEP1GSC194_2586 [Leptospira alstonii serovar Sichuan str. 79601]EQA80881.1 hypothetical protein LEP1GSC193_2548 [Leptospira alstonii serovar Pingchang str. 80-412]